MRGAGTGFLRRVYLRSLPAAAGIVRSHWARVGGSGEVTIEFRAMDEKHRYFNGLYVDAGGCRVRCGVITTVAGGYPPISPGKALGTEIAAKQAGIGIGGELGLLQYQVGGG